MECLLKQNACINSVCTSETGRKYASLHEADILDNEEMVALLLRRGAEVDVRGEGGITPFHIATHYERIKILNKLLDMDANINSTYTSSGDEGFTALHFVSKYPWVPNWEKTVELLLRRGADVNAKDKSDFPLFLAIENGPTHL